MTNRTDLFWQASLEDIKKGYIYREATDEYTCLICGQTYLNGMVYPSEDGLFEAKRYIQVHITKAHKSTFHYLLTMDKKFTGLTDHQKTLLELFHDGKSDNDVAKAIGTGSTSTIRNHRFTLREKQKQAKIFLAIMELLGDQFPRKNSLAETTCMTRRVDNRFAVTEQENEKILASYFKEGLDGPLDVYPLKEKKRVTILRHIIKYFDANKTYTEKEVNSILEHFYTDYVLLRRQLIEYGFLDRTRDGKSYWVNV